jgi:hypothetical protein
MKVWIKSMAAIVVFTGAVVAAHQAQAGSIETQYLREFPAWPVNNDPITGQWKFTFVATSSTTGGPPPGALVDSGFVTWHDDGTDLIHSSHPPITDSIAEGVWRKLGNTYQANNWALPWSADGTSFSGPVNIQESITLDKGSSTYSGTFTITIYGPPTAQSINPLNKNESVLPGMYLFDTSGGKVLEICGVINGARVTFED